MPPFSQLELENFKNYRLRTTFQWMQVTAILGQNGTGKSTIVDAVEFVCCFPIYSNKSVAKLKKVLYHKDSEENEHSSSWVSATVIIDNVPREFKRLVNYKNSAHEYRIDNKVVDINEYKSLLLKININPKANNFLVRQNAIISLTIQSAKQRREFFEVLSSSIIYKSDYDKSLSKIKSMESEVTNLHNNLILLRKEKHCLALKNKEIKAYDVLNEKLRAVETEYYLTKLYECQRTIDSLKAGRQDKKNHKSKAEQLINEFRKNVETLKSDMEEKEKNLSNIEEELKSNESQYSAYKMEGIELVEKISQKTKQIEGVDRNIQRARNIQEACVNTLEDLRQQLIVTEEEINQLNKSQYISIDLDSNQYEEYLELKAETQRHFFQNNQDFPKLKREYDGVRDKIGEKENKKKMLSIQIRKEESIRDGIIVERTNIDQKRYQTEQDITRTKAECNRLEDEIRELQIDVDNTISSIQDINDDLKNFDIQRQESSHNRRQTEIINNLKAEFPGVLGRLVQLCIIPDPNYDVAITTILGNKMNDIIVDSNNTGLQCIAYLKEHYKNDDNPAVATFHPVENLKSKTLPDSLSNIIKRKQSAKFALDVIRARNTENEAEVNAALKSFLGNIVIFESNEECKQFSKIHRVNCVSLDGTYYRKDGIISGGYSDMKRKAKQWNAEGYQKKKEEKKEKTEALKNVQLRIREKMNSQNDLKIKLLGLESRLKDYLKPALDKCDAKLKAKQNEIEILKNKIKSYESDSTLKELQKLLCELEDKMKIIKEVENEIEDDVFSNFCKRFGLQNIRQYKENDLRKHEEQAKRRIDLENLKGKIDNQIEFEKNLRKTNKNKITEYKNKVSILEKEKEELLRQKESWDKRRKENDHSSELKTKIQTMRRNIADIKRDLAREKELLSIAKKDLKSYEETIAIQTSHINRMRLKFSQISMECKIKGIDIPGLEELLEIQSKITGVETESSDQQTESDSAMLDENTIIDFSELNESAKKLVPSELNKKIESLRKEVEELKLKMNACIPSNRNLKRELVSLDTKIKDAKKELNEKVKSCNTNKSTFEDIRKQRKELFYKFHNSVEMKIDPIIKSLYNDSAAQASLIMTNQDEPWLGEVTLNCLVPNKKFHKIENLSGGEKTMCAVALFLAVFNALPAPCIIFDEIDAALDNVNLDNLVNIIMKWKASTQIIIISHHERLFRCADAAVGINISTRRNSSYAVHVDLTKYRHTISSSPRARSLVGTPTRSSEYQSSGHTTRSVNTTPNRRKRRTNTGSERNS